MPNLDFMHFDQLFDKLKIFIYFLFRTEKRKTIIQHKYFDTKMQLLQVRIQQMNTNFFIFLYTFRNDKICLSRYRLGGRFLSKDSPLG